MTYFFKKQILSINSYFYRYIIDTRNLYTMIKQVFYSNVPTKVLELNPSLKPEEMFMSEFEKGELALQSITDDVNHVLKGKITFKYTLLL